MTLREDPTTNSTNATAPISDVQKLKFRRTYILALSVLALTSFCALVLVKKIIASEKTTAAIVNASGKRRVTSQRMAFFAERLVAARDSSKRKEARHDLKEALNTFEECHEGLIHGSSRLHLPGEPSEALRTLYFEEPIKLDDAAKLYIQTARRLLNTNDSDLHQLRGVVENMVHVGTTELLSKLDQAVSLYQTESEIKVDQLEKTEIAVFIFTVLVLILEALFIFGPMERKLAQALHDLDSTNRTIDSILNSLGQGFLMTKRNGVCSTYHSSACKDLLECIPSGKHLTDVLRIEPGAVASFNAWLEELFAESLSFQDLQAFAPKHFGNSVEKFVSLDWKPVRDPNGKIESIVMIATDRTAEQNALQALDREKAFASMVTKLIKKRSQFVAFVWRTRERLDSIQTAIQQGNFALALLETHTIKGGASLYSLIQVRNAAGDFEKILSDAQSGPALETSRLKTEASRFHVAFENSVKVAEEVLGIALDKPLEVKEISIEQLKVFSTEIDTLKEAKKIRAKFIYQFIEESIGKYFGHYQEYVNALAERLGKDRPAVKMINGDLKINAEPYIGLIDSMIHAIRNSLDHGIESAEERVGKNKSPSGLIEMEFSRVDDDLTIEIRDDGRGIDLEGIKNYLRRNGRAKEADQKSEHELVQVVFESKLTTKEAVSETSGMGVGLNSLQAEAKKLGGHVIVQSTRGAGTKLTVRVPWIEFSGNFSYMPKSA